MNFDRDDEQRAIAEAARELLTARGPEGDFWPELCQLGWPGIAVAEEHGGGGLGLAELTILIEEHGYACAAIPLLGTTLAALAIGACGSDEQRRELLRSRGNSIEGGTTEILKNIVAERVLGLPKGR